ncbi:MAG: hypothetical protein K0Q81_1965 [Paenibacillus sp.]|nr:hypothetical protein [Paenibacillus sp.]
MMIGTVRWNLVLGVIGFGFTFFLSVGDNFLTTTLLHSFYGFIIMFGVSFVVRWVLGTLAGLKEMQDSTAVSESSDEGKGSAVDSVTPDEQEELNKLLKDNLNGAGSSTDEFTLLKPKKLASLPAEPEELAQALRRLTEE